MIEQAAKMELAGLKHVNFDGLRPDMKLTRQEMLITICYGEILINAEHELQKQPRVDLLMHAIKNCGADLNKMNCQFVVNMCDDIETSDPSAPRLSYTKRDGSCNILIPDAHFLNVCNIVSQIPKVDPPWEDKKDIAVFAGSDTGFYKTADKNQRFQFCHQNQDNPKGHFKITNFVEIDSDSLGKYKLDKIYSHPISIEEQLNYKFIVNINGNATSWDRLLWAMSSNSLCLYVRPQVAQRSWYYHIFDVVGGPIYVDEDSWEPTIDYLLKEEAVASNINYKQQKLARVIANVENQLKYFRIILEKYNKAYNKNE